MQSHPQTDNYCQNQPTNETLSKTPVVHIHDIRIVCKSTHNIWRGWHKCFATANKEDAYCLALVLCVLQPGWNNRHFKYFMLIGKTPMMSALTFNIGQVGTWPFTRLVHGQPPAQIFPIFRPVSFTSHPKQSTPSKLFDHVYTRERQEAAQVSSANSAHFPPPASTFINCGSRNVVALAAHLLYAPIINRESIRHTREMLTAPNKVQIGNLLCARPGKYYMYLLWEP